MRRFLSEIGGGTFEGAPPLIPGNRLNGRIITGKEYPAIDGFFVHPNGDKVPVSLKELTSSNPNRVLKETRDVIDAANDFNVSNITVLVNAPKISLSKFTNFVNNGPLLNLAGGKSPINSIVVKTSGGYVYIQDGAISNGVPKGFLK